MKDTTPEMEKRFLEMVMERSGEERLLMGFSMCDFARRQVIASIKMKDPQADERKIRRGLFLRYYGHDFSSEEREKILTKLI